MQHLKQVKVFVDQLERGMFISKLDREWSESTFLMQGFAVESDDDIEAVKKQCSYVFVDFPNEQSYRAYRQKHTPIRENSSVPKRRRVPGIESIRDEIKPAAKAMGKAKGVVKDVLSRVMLGETFEVAAVKQVVSECVQSILREESALLFMTMIKNKDEYTAEHSLNVGVTCIAFARFLGLSEEKMEEVGLCGMLHDIGKIKVPNHILNKPDRLNADEAAIMRKHADFGYEILLKKRDLAPSAIDVAYSHHERLNGRGYPRGLTGDQLSFFTRMVAIVDTFDAITSARCYEQARSIMDAYRVLMAGRETHFDAKLVTKFVQWRGIYPPGSIVEMESGEVGIVTATNPAHKLRPKVLMILDGDKQPRHREQFIDLAKLDNADEDPRYRITRAVADRAYGVDLQTYVDKGLRIAAV